MAKQIRFTKKELDLVIEMTGIADAGLPEGDYQRWDTDKKYDTLESLTDKVLDLLIRLEK